MNLWDLLVIKHFRFRFAFGFVCSNSQLAWQCQTWSRIRCWRFGWNSGRMRGMVPWDMPQETPNGWNLSKILHSHQRHEQSGSRSLRVHTSSTWMVRNMEANLCGKWCHDWTPLLINLNELFWNFQSRSEYIYKSVKEAMLFLLEKRRELLAATLTQDQTMEMRMQIVSKIDCNNR